MPKNIVQYVTNPTTAPILSKAAVATAVHFPDESCPPMRCLRHSNRANSLFMLTAAHIPTNLSAVGLGIHTFPLLFSLTHCTRDPNESAHVQL